jgi:CHAD domain-containing protein
MSATHDFRLMSRLTKNGACATALDPAEAVEEFPDRIRAHMSAGEAVSVFLARTLRLLLLHQPAALRGDAEAVHQMRKAIRRLRAELRMCRTLVTEDWAGALNDRLKQLGRTLGNVRDLDVVRERLVHSGGPLATDLGPLFALVDQRIEAARAAASTALESDAHWQLIVDLSQAAREPALTELAGESCDAALPPLVAQPWKRLREAGRALAPEADDEAVHDVRIHAKRVRYAAEAVVDVLAGKAADTASRFAGRLAQIQDVLGDEHDSIMAREVILEAARLAPAEPRFQLAAGQLLERQEQIRRDARGQFSKGWRKLDRKAIRVWR